MGLGLAWLALLAGAQSAAAANLAYHGGPVAHSMTGVLVDWGPDVNPLYTNETTGDPGLLKYLAGVSGWARVLGGVLAQYMDASGQNAANAVAYGRQYEITPANAAATLADADIQTELIGQIQAGNLPRPTGDGLQTVYLVLFPAADTECNQAGCDGQAFCSYHGHTVLGDGTNVLYVVLPDMSQICGGTFTSQTAYLGRAWADTIIDPLGTAWSDSTGHEAGEECGTRTTTFGSWTLPLVWSNLNSGCMGREWSYAVPNARFVLPSTGTQGQPVTADGSSSNDPSGDIASLTYASTSYSLGSGITSYSWSWGDGGMSQTTTPTASHAYSSPGTYQVTLTVTDDLGFTGTATHPVAVAAPPPPPQIPVATTGDATQITPTGAQLAGSVDPAGPQVVRYRFSYGTSATSLIQTTSSATASSGTTAVPVSGTLSGLALDTRYFFRLDVTLNGHTYSGQVQSFTTSIPPPAVLSLVPSWVTNTSATIAGIVDTSGFDTTYHFEFGTTTAYGQSSPPVTASPGGSAVSVETSLSSLLPGTTYHYRLVAYSPGGSTFGPDGAFTTGASPKPPPRFALRVAKRVALRDGLKVQFACSTACVAYLDAVVAPGHGSLGLPQSLAHAVAEGPGTATLTFPPKVRAALRRHRRIELLVTGYAKGAGTLASVPALASFTLTR